jgi:protocatechuate 3,4-dioxygenase beta subunit
MFKQNENLDRRNFLRLAAKAAIVLPILGGALELSACGSSERLFAQPSQTSPASSSSSATRAAKISLVADGEPGEPLIVSGVIYAPDGRTPLESINLFVYQTDATGRYSTSGGDNRNTRLHGVTQTGSDGRYEFRTIKPASYPDSRIAAHIHAYVSGPGYPEYWIDEYHFADDPFVTADMRAKDAGKGSKASILTLTRGADGVWRGVRDITIERCSKNCTGR